MRQPPGEERLDVADELMATDGRAPGHRGQATRGRLLECTAELLGTTPYRSVRVIDIASAAGTSPATFYQYFPDVEHALLVLAEEAARGARFLPELARADWREAEGFATARRLVEGFTAWWESHRAVLRVLELSAQEGDLRFASLRSKALNGLFEAFAEAIEDARRHGHLLADIEPRATAAVLVSMLAHVGAHRYGLEFWGIRTADLEESLSRTIYWTVTGRTPPEGGRTKANARTPNA